jgi:hypothetical protein
MEMSDWLAFLGAPESQQLGAESVASTIAVRANRRDWGGRIRTSECVVQSHVPCHLATPHPLSSGADISL